MFLNCKIHIIFLLITTDSPDTETDTEHPTESISGDDPPHQHRKRRRSHEDKVVFGDDVAQLVGGKSENNFVDFCSSLSFRSYLTHLQWKPSVVRAVSTGGVDYMIENSSRMVASLSETDVNHGILQYLELARQIEAVAEHQNRHSYSVVSEICGEGNRLSCLSLQTAKRVLKAAYSVYRYPILSQVKASWSKAFKFLPALADLLDNMILENQPLPANIISAQEERHKVNIF